MPWTSIVIYVGMEIYIAVIWKNTNGKHIENTVVYKTTGERAEVRDNFMKILYQSSGCNSIFYQSDDAGNPCKIDWSKSREVDPPVPWRGDTGLCAGKA